MAHRGKRHKTASGGDAEEGLMFHRNGVIEREGEEQNSRDVGVRGHNDEVFENVRIEKV